MLPLLSVSLLPLLSVSLACYATRMNETPIFTVTAEAKMANHYSNHGFDPEISYLQEMEDALCQPKRGDKRVVDSLRCKLKKPIAKDDARAKKRRRGWWKSALLFWKRPELGRFEENNARRRSPAKWPEGSGSLYSTDTVGVGRRARRPSSGLLLAAAEIGAEAAVGVAYVNLRDLSLGDGRRVAHYAVLPPAAPIYLVT